MNEKINMSVDLSADGAGSTKRDIEQKAEQQERINNFRSIARKYFEFNFPINRKNEENYDDWLQIRQTFVRKVIKIPKIIVDQICEEEKQRALNIPESTFMSDQAYDKFVKSTSDLQMSHTGTLEEMRASNPGALAEYFGAFDFENVEGPLKNAQFIIVSKMIDGKSYEVGGTAYDITTGIRGERRAYVIFQKAFNFPGLGLAMLNSLIERAEEDNFSGIDLTTHKTPLGLGNIGFEYLPVLGDYGQVYYKKEIIDKESEIEKNA
ncbi:MAG: hypothetical protein WCO23_03595 [bacterium]